MEYFSLSLDTQQAQVNECQETQIVSRFQAEVENHRLQVSKNSIKDVGQIDSISLPTGWAESAIQTGAAPGSSYREIASKDNPDARIAFFYRGHKLASADGAQFHSCLKDPAHTLSATELQSLSAVLRDRIPGGFTVSNAATLDLQGKRVLQVEGQYSQSKQQTKAIFIDADGTGRVV